VRLGPSRLIGEAEPISAALRRAHPESACPPDFDLDRLVALCRWRHDQTDVPYVRGRLVVTVLGDGQFLFDVVKRGTARECPSQDL